ncbi:uncharacterized protein Fot_11084 [Forsythia ovata]|uniref:Uncharacterized protein n=1 Tax=Forsythia ovata TaxID=205694 RepID=A0ABD1WIQ5_9LAMI
MFCSLVPYSCFVLDSTAIVGDITPSDGIPKHEKEKSTRAQSTATRVNYLVEGHESICMLFPSQENLTCGIDSIVDGSEIEFLEDIGDCIMAHYNSKTMSRRPNSTRRLADSGGIPFMGSLHSKSRLSPLLSVGLLSVVSLQDIDPFISSKSVIRMHSSLITTFVESIWWFEWAFVMVVGVIEEARKLPNNKSLFIENVVATSLIGGEFLTDCLLKSLEHRHFCAIKIGQFQLDAFFT